MSLTFKLLIGAIVLFVVYAAWPPKVSDAQRLEQARQTLKQSCASKGASSTTLPQQTLDAYCTCTAERAIVELGSAGVKRLSGASELTAQDQQMIQRVQAACLDSLRK